MIPSVILCNVLSGEKSGKFKSDTVYIYEEKIKILKYGTKTKKIRHI